MRLGRKVLGVSLGRSRSCRFRIDMEGPIVWLHHARIKYPGRWKWCDGLTAGSDLEKSSDTRRRSLQPRNSGDSPSPSRPVFRLLYHPSISQKLSIPFHLHIPSLSLGEFFTLAKPHLQPWPESRSVLESRMEALCIDPLPIPG